jgi:hypothetical protein
MPNTKPKDYASTLPYKSSLPAGAIENIQKKTGIRLSNDLKTQLEQISKRYIADKELIDQIPRRSEVKARLKKLIKGTEKYLELLRETDDWTKQHLDAQCSEYVGLCNIYDTRRNVSGFLAACENTLQDLPEDAGGRNKELQGLYIYIASLASIYEEAIGKKPSVYYSVHSESWYGREFINFVETCLAEIGQPTDEPTALPDRIRKALTSNLSQEILYWS